MSLRAGVLARCRPIALLAAIAAVAAVGAACDRTTGQATPPRQAVVVYTSVDQPLAEPILRRFTEQTGIRLSILYDTEATKTTGLVNRLIAESEAPRADVFWNSEFLRTLVLRCGAVLAPYDSPAAEGIPDRYRDPDRNWTGQALRARALVWRDDRVASPPRDLTELTTAAWRGRTAMAYPLFGTTASHVAALFESWGPDRAGVFLRALRDNDLRIVDGNSTARDLVVSGAVDVALTDTDDFAVARSRGVPLSMAFAKDAQDGTFVIPSTVALIRGGPNPSGGRALIDFLLSREVEASLVQGPGAFMPLREDAPWPDHLPGRDRLQPMELDWNGVEARLGEAMLVCRDLFLRR